MSGKIKYGNNGITFPKGFIANGVISGLKKNNKLDLGLVFSTEEANAGGVFTENLFIAAPIAYSRKTSDKTGKCRALIANSGNANACCGKYGETVVNDTVCSVSEALKIKKEHVMVFSTGSIGKKLPYEKIKKSLPLLIKDLNKKNGKIFSQSIMTTDSFMKCRSAEFKVNGLSVKIGLSAKGAGMIEPSMATMLCFITSDIFMPAKLIKPLLKEVAGLTFNRISVDGDMSTNDSIVLLCNGLSGVSVKTKDDQGYKLLRESLIHICGDIAEAIVADGEGATKVIHVTVLEAKSEKDAQTVCRSIGNCLLLKCAIFGERPNWGRIMSSVGAARVKFDISNFSASLQGHTFFKNGEPDFSAADRIEPLMKKRDINIIIRLGIGASGYSMLASDIGFKYVEINKE